MNKRFKFLVGSGILAGLFFLILTLPYEWQDLAIMVMCLWLVFVYWLILGLVNYKDWMLKVLLAFLPLSFFIGFVFFVILIPFTIPLGIILAVVFAAVNYIIFLVENIFLVAIGYKTVPLYRAAYTMALIVILLASFFVFNSIFSFNLGFLENGGLAFLAGLMIFGYLFWAITIELPDDGKNKSLFYIVVPALVLGEMSAVFSFWPLGIFRRSIFLVCFIYVMATLMQADIKERLFTRTWKGMTWVFIALVLGMLSVTRWGEAY